MREVTFRFPTGEAPSERKEIIFRNECPNVGTRDAFRRPEVERRAGRRSERERDRETELNRSDRAKLFSSCPALLAPVNKLA